MIKTTVQYFCDACKVKLPNDTPEYMFPAYKTEFGSGSHDDPLGNCCGFTTKRVATQVHFCDNCAKKISNFVFNGTLLVVT